MSQVPVMDLKALEDLGDRVHSSSQSHLSGLLFKFLCVCVTCVCVCVCVCCAGEAASLELTVAASGQSDLVISKNHAHY